MRDGHDFMRAHGDGKASTQYIPEATSTRKTIERLSQQRVNRACKDCDDGLGCCTHRERPGVQLANRGRSVRVSIVDPSSSPHRHRHEGPSPSEGLRLEEMIRDRPDGRAIRPDVADRRRSSSTIGDVTPTIRSCGRSVSRAEGTWRPWLGDDDAVRTSSSSVVNAVHEPGYASARISGRTRQRSVPRQSDRRRASSAVDLEVQTPWAVHRGTVANRCGNTPARLHAINDRGVNASTFLVTQVRRRQRNARSDESLRLKSGSTDSTD